MPISPVCFIINSAPVSGSVFLEIPNFSPPVIPAYHPFVSSTFVHLNKQELSNYHFLMNNLTNTHAPTDLPLIVTGKQIDIL